MISGTTQACGPSAERAKGAGVYDQYGPEPDIEKTPEFEEQCGTDAGADSGSGVESEPSVENGPSAKPEAQSSQEREPESGPEPEPDHWKTVEAEWLGADQSEGVRWDGKPPDRIDQLFIRMQVNYGHIWSSRFGTDELMRAGKAEWAGALSRCSDQRLEIGISRCFGEYGKPPSMTEFVRCCLPTLEEFDLPHQEEAYREACLKSHNPNGPKVIGSWSHAAVYLAGQSTGWHDLQCSLMGVQKRFDKTYLRLCREVMSGAKLTIPQPRARALEQHQKGQSQRTEQEMRTAQGFLDQLKSQLGMTHGNQAND